VSPQPYQLTLPEGPFKVPNSTRATW